MQGTLIIGIIFALLVAVFSIQNAIPVSISFFTWRFETSLVVVVLGGIALGVLMMGLFASFKQFKLKRKIKGLKSETKKIEAEKENMKTDISELEAKLQNPGDAESKTKNEEETIENDKVNKT